MPSAPSTPCSAPCCPEPATYKGRCRTHARAQEQTRYNVSTRKWYSTEAWRNLRLLVLADQPTCRDCHRAPSTIADHVIPHRGNSALFWDRANVQGLCVACHGRKTQRGE